MVRDFEPGHLHVEMRILGLADFPFLKEQREKEEEKYYDWELVMEENRSARA